MLYIFFNDTATTEIYTLSLHDALPIWPPPRAGSCGRRPGLRRGHPSAAGAGRLPRRPDLRQRSTPVRGRSEEHTSELQSRQYLVCRLLLEKKKLLLWYISSSTNVSDKN